MDQNNPLYKNKHYIVVEGSYRYSIPAIKFYEVREIQPRRAGAAPEFKTGKMFAAIAKNQKVAYHCRVID